MDLDSGACCISQSYLERAKSAFEDSSEKYESLFGAKPNFSSPQTLVYKPKSETKRYTELKVCILEVF